MRKILTILLAAMAMSSLAAASYNDNKYQRMADDCIRQAEAAKRAGQYEKAIEYAEKAEEYAGLSKQFIMGDSGPKGEFPEYYIVGTWSGDRDCLWNIAGRAYVYNNSRLWQKIYNDNKENFPDPDNPNLIKPGMRLHIPSIKGEARSGTYEAGGSYGKMQ